MTMDGNGMTHRARLEPQNVTYEHICAMHLQTVRGVLRTAQCSRQCALWCSCQLFDNVLKVVEVVREDVRSFP